MNRFHGGTSLSALAESVGKLLIGRKLSCATAESCTGGLVGAAISSIPGSSAYFRGGIIAYENRVKKELLGVPEKTLVEHGAVSAETVIAMAEGAARLLSSDCVISVSGIAGPQGGSPEKPVGLVYIGIHVTGSNSSFKHLFSGNRDSVRMAAVEAALKHLVEAVEQGDTR